MMSLNQLIETRSFMRVLSRGRGLNKIVGDDDLGFKGDCYEFAVAVKRSIGGKYVQIEGTLHVKDFDQHMIDHVLVEIDGNLVDADGIHDKAEYLQSARNRLGNDFNIVDANIDEIEKIAEEPRVAWILRKLSRCKARNRDE
jgi:hypothetical protein